MQLPENVVATVRAVCLANRESLDDQIAKSIKAVRDLDDFEDFAQRLIDGMIQEAVYDERHRINYKPPRNVKEYGLPSPVAGKQHKMANRMLNEAFVGGYSHYIAGTTLGNITGDQIDGIVASEEAISATHHGLANVLRWCKSRGVVGEKRVRDVIKERDLRRNFERILAAARKGNEDAA